MLAGLRGDRTVRDICREYEIAETLYYQWRDRLLEGGKAALVTSRDKSNDGRDAELRDAKKRSRSWSGRWGRPTSWRSRGTLAGLDVSVRVSRARVVVARGRRPAVVARVAGISRQALYRPVRRRPVSAGPVGECGSNGVSGA